MFRAWVARPSRISFRFCPGRISEARQTSAKNKEEPGNKEEQKRGGVNVGSHVFQLELSKILSVENPGAAIGWLTSFDDENCQFGSSSAR